jgi:mono/diheme cytochrome c family protein
MRSLRLLVISAFALALVTVSASAQSKGPNPKAATIKNPVPSTPASIAKGQQAFSKNCRHCHGLRGLGDGPLAPKNPSPANLTDDTWDHGSTDGEIYFIIANGAGPGSEMKGVRSELTPTDMWNIVNFIRSLGPKTDAR